MTTTSTPRPRKLSTAQEVVKAYDGSPSELIRFALRDDPSRVSRVRVLRKMMRTSTAERVQQIEEKLVQKMKEQERQKQQQVKKIDRKRAQLAGIIIIIITLC